MKRLIEYAYKNRYIDTYGANCSLTIRYSELNENDDISDANRQHACQGASCDVKESISVDLSK